MPVSGSRPILVPLVVACAMFMQNLDSTVIATALPTIAQSLGENPLTLNVAITCYLLSLAVFIPISGWTADRFGARRVFSLAIVVFTLGSIGVLGIVLVNLLVSDLKDAGRRPFDLAGFALTGVGLATLAFGFENVGRGALPSFLVVALLAVGAACTVLYVRHARRVAYPII